MHASFVTTHHVPTLSRSHTISLYALSHCLALSRSHTESRSLLHQLPHHDGIFLWQRLTSSRFIPHTSDCVSRDRTIQRTGTEPRTVRRTIQRTGNFFSCRSFLFSRVNKLTAKQRSKCDTGNTHCCCSSCCCTHTVAPTTAALLMHHTSHRSSHQPCTATLILHHIAHPSTHQPLLHQSLLHRPLLHRPLLH